jgi:hypothetical protein
MPGPTTNVGQIAMINRRPGIDGNRPRDQIDRDIQSPGLAGQNTQQMQRISVTGNLGEDLAVDRFGLSQPPGLVMPNGNPGKLINIFLRHQGGL